MKYVIESIGYNDGHPYEEFVCDENEDVTKIFVECCNMQPKVAHRLIEIIEERGPVNAKPE